MRFSTTVAVALPGGLAAAVIIATSPVPPPVQPSTCVINSDTVASYLSFFKEDLLTDPDSIHQEVVDSLNIGGVSPEAVQLITDESACVAARQQVVEWVADEALPNARVVLIDVGGVVRAVVTEYLFFGEYAMLFIYDPSDWEILFTVAF